MHDVRNLEEKGQSQRGVNAWGSQVVTTCEQQLPVELRQNFEQQLLVELLQNFEQQLLVELRQNFEQQLLVELRQNFEQQLLVELRQNVVIFGVTVEASTDG